MGVKYVFIITVLFCVVTGYFCNSVKFCSGETIKYHFEGLDKGSALKLDGSNSAVSHSLTKYGRTACTCVVIPTESIIPDKLQVDLKYSTGLTNLNTCDKSLVVKDNDGNVVHTFGCASDNIEVHADDMEEGIQFTLNLYEGLKDNRVVDDTYILYVVPEPGAILTVKCYEPVLATTLSTTTPSHSSSTTTPTTTRPFVKTGSFDTSIVVGIVVGLGLFLLVFISCMLYYIARRRSRREIDEKPNLSTQQQQQSRHIVNRTLTSLYDKMKVNRPLPRLPASIRNITPWKTRNISASGVYDSIKSSKNKAKYQLDRQESKGSDCSYMEPVAITTISESVTINGRKGFHSKKDEKPKNLKLLKMHAQSSPLPPSKRSLVVKDVEHKDLSDATYIHPVSKTKSVDGNGHQGDETSLQHAYGNNPPAHTYMNTGEAQSVMNDRNTQNFETEQHDPEYMRMCSRAETSNNQDSLDKKGTDTKEYHKEEPTTEDGTMNVPNAKCLLQKNDSTFPELIDFTPHERDSKDPRIHNSNCMIENTENKNGEGQKMKNKRFVKDKKSKHIDSDEISAF